MNDPNQPSGSHPDPIRPGSLPPDAVQRAVARQRLRRRISFLGCGCFIVLAAVGIAFLFVVYKGATNLAADFADPEAREKKVLVTLGADALPEGYHAAMVVDVPLPFDMVVLNDEPWLVDGLTPEDETPLPVFNGVPGSKLFYFIHIRAEDRTGNDPFEREYASEENLGQGDLEVHGQRVAWEAHRGQSLRPQGDANGIFVRLRLECEDRETRRAVWFHQIEQTDTELENTPADPKALVAFLSHFRVCGTEKEEDQDV